MKKIAVFAALTMFASTAAHAQAWIERAFDKMDTDGNDIVTQAEWDADGRQSNNFGVGDTNDDGEMTLEEFTALIKKWQAANNN